MEKKWFIGIDISKKTLDVVIYVPTKKHADETNYERFLNKEEGYKSLLCWLNKNRKFLQNIRSVACTGFPSMLYYPEECQGKEEEHGKEKAGH